MRNKIIIIALILFLLYSAVSKIKESDSETFSDIYYKNNITLEDYNAIKNGMSYDEVCERFYGEGILIAETDLGLGLAYDLTYVWEGAGFVGASVKITFRYGKVIEKEQIGLI